MYVTFDKIFQDEDRGQSIRERERTSEKRSPTNLRKCPDLIQEYPARFVVDKVDKVCQDKDESLSINEKTRKKPLGKNFHKAIKEIPNLTNSHSRVSNISVNTLLQILTKLV